MKKALLGMALLTLAAPAIASTKETAIPALTPIIIPTAPVDAAAVDQRFGSPGRLGMLANGHRCDSHVPNNDTRC